MSECPPHDDDDVIDLTLPEDDDVIDLNSPIRAAAGVFVVSTEGAAQRLPLRADEYRRFVLGV